MRNKKPIVFGIITLIILLAVIIALFLRNRILDFEYIKLEDGTWEVSRYCGEVADVEIPSQYRGKAVTRIGDECFFDVGANRVTKVIIPKTVTSIGKKAFYSVNKKELEILGAENVRTVEEEAFYRRNIKGDLTFISRVEQLGDLCFCGVEGLDVIEINYMQGKIGEGTFALSDLENINIGNEVTSIGADAFYGTPWLEKQMGDVIVGDGILIKCQEKGKVIEIPKGIKQVSLSENISEEIKEVYISRDVAKIENYLLDENREIVLFIPNSVIEIDKVMGDGVDNISYSNMDKVTMVVEAGSYAEEYAKRKAEETGLKYQVVERIKYPSE